MHSLTTHIYEIVLRVQNLFQQYESTMTSHEIPLA